ncbi:MAG TPA: homoserine dehydrogenase [Clostridiales bacterium]|nr:homoserine dehydrogenase [Clostridiales bacterium]
MKIAILGFGTVGTGVYEIIKNSNASIIKNFEITKILVRNKDKISSPIMTDNYDEIIEDNSINIVVEVMGGAVPTYEYILRALKAKKHVVTANKEVVALHLDEFTKIASENNVSIHYEASVGGGIPWIKSIIKAKRIDKIQEISGILNGTSNFILYNMFKNGYEFNDILKIAQEKGYAETDPSADIDGIDVQRKLSITTSLCFDTIVPQNNIPTFGIRNVTKQDIDYFKNNNFVLKLIAKSVLYNDSYCSCVEPVLFNKNSIEANVDHNYNIGSLVGESIGELKFYGQGAGKFPTANAVIQDILDIYYGDYKDYNLNFNEILDFDGSLICSNYYIRFSNEKIKNIFESNTERLFNLDDKYCIITKVLSKNDFQSLISMAIKCDNNLFYARYN